MRMWPGAYGEAVQAAFRRRQGQLTTVDAAQYPLQSHVQKPSDGRGLAPGSEVNIMGPLIRYIPRQTIVGIPGQHATQLAPGVRATAGELAVNNRVGRLTSSTHASQLDAYQRKDLRGEFTQYGSYGEAATAYGRG